MNIQYIYCDPGSVSSSLDKIRKSLKDTVIRNLRDYCLSNQVTNVALYSIRWNETNLFHPLISPPGISRFDHYFFQSLNFSHLFCAT